MDAALAIDRLKSALKKKFGGIVEPDAEFNERKFLTRSLVAAYITDRFGVSPSIGNDAITDDSNDGGIDGVFIDTYGKKIYLLQSKFSDRFDKQIDQGDSLKFLRGVKQITRADFANLSKKLLSKKPIIEEALRDVDYTVTIVFISTFSNPLSTHVQNDLDEFLESANSFDSNFVSFESLDLSDVSKLGVRVTRPSEISFNTIIKSFGKLHEPNEVIHGLVSASELHKLYKKHGLSLFNENVRFFLGASTVNEGIYETASQSPRLFPYFNNGITALCSGIDKAPMGGGDSQVGLFEFKGFSIVNGAQTVGTISSVIDGGFYKDFDVFIKIISLENAEETFGSKITRYTNTQNELQAMDFVALDPNQERLRNDFAKLDVAYIFRRGGSRDPNLTDKIDVSEATIALACCNDDLRITVIAKRNVSQLWDPITKAPYTKLFNDNLNASRLKNFVFAVRNCQKFIIEKSVGMSGRDELITVHGNRFITHVMFSHNSPYFLNFDAMGEKDHIQFKEQLSSVTDNVVSYLNANYVDAYPGNFFKNTDKQLALKKSLFDGAIPTADTQAKLDL